ncbi:YetF domain-containing protein [Streptomyces sp. VB1]|uniref:YetF domain-containing protein n=1 Tax=Streptomyces sp. VB1 TaxID=2986803 RepID=UPI002ADE1203|nr:YetF domain-containing protein [Streptomyces sp. VB1]
MLLCDGRMLHDAMRRRRATVDEVRQAVRTQGTGGLELVHAVVLETDGTSSLIRHSQRGSGSALANADRAQARDDVADRPSVPRTAPR